MNKNHGIFGDRIQKKCDEILEVSFFENENCRTDFCTFWDNIPFS